MPFISAQCTLKGKNRRTGASITKRLRETRPKHQRQRQQQLMAQVLATKRRSQSGRPIKELRLPANKSFYSTTPLHSPMKLPLQTTHLPHGRAPPIPSHPAPTRPSIYASSVTGIIFSAPRAPLTLCATSTGRRVHHSGTRDGKRSPCPRWNGVSHISGNKGKEEPNK